MRIEETQLSGVHLIARDIFRDHRGHFSETWNERRYLEPGIAGPDVAVDLRVGSDTFGRWAGFVLSSDHGRQLYIPSGFAHGFLVLSEEAIFSYKRTDFYTPHSERTVLWSDPAIGIEWPISEPVLSDKDRAGLCLSEIPLARLPRLEKPT